MSIDPGQKPSAVTIRTLNEMKARGEKIACLTAYDASFTRLLEQAGVEVLLVGDSLGMVVQGHDSTVPVTLDDMIYHAAAVARARRKALLMVDLPFMSYASPAQALDSAARLMREGGAQMVKLEGGSVQLEVVRALTARGIPVCAHIGLTPQSVHKLSGYRVQGREQEVARVMEEDAARLEEAGADLLLLECVPAPLAGAISREVDIPVIGIGAGPDCGGQILVLHDMLGITSGHRPRFVRDFLSGAEDIAGALGDYVSAVKDGRFPAPEHCF